MPPRPCPCGSGQPYAACCAPFHKGEREAPTPEALMRSRYAAFVEKQAPYLVRTLHPSHEDHGRPELLAASRNACATNRYLGLTVLEVEAPDAEGVAYVTFRAKVFRKGVDLSFVERSRFERDGEGWRYVGGELRGADPLGQRA